MKKKPPPQDEWEAKAPKEVAETLSLGRSVSAELAISFQ